jgi:hypothetical protein
MKLTQQMLFELSDIEIFIVRYHGGLNHLIYACLEDGDTLTMVQPYERCPWHQEITNA